MGTKTFLLADDDRDDIDMFCEALLSIDPSIICHFAGNGRLALKMLNELKEKPHIIFLDVNMPVMTGWQCLKLLKEDEQYKHLPVIVTSTSSHLRELDMAAEFGALCYFTKPNNFDELTRVLQVIVANLGAGLEDALTNLQASGSKCVYTFRDGNTRTKNT